MGRQITGTYDDWIAHVFDHPVGEREWYWEDDAVDWNADTASTAKYITRMFEESGKLPERFSDAQIRIGLNYIVSNSCSDHFYSLLDSKLPWELRKAALASIYNVFADLFAARCTEHLGHLDEAYAGALNSICYMWWDIAPVHGEPDNPTCKERDALLLKVMTDTLKLNSEPCLESALHGLGHWQSYYPDKVKDIIHDFIWKNRKIRDPLRNYAYAAMNGDVL